MASEDILDERTREILKHAYEASNLIINKVEQLLSLTEENQNAKDGLKDVSGETFELKMTGKHSEDFSSAKLTPTSN